MDMLKYTSPGNDSTIGYRCEPGGKIVNLFPKSEHIEIFCDEQHDRFDEESGSVTVDFVIWLPLVLILSMLVFEATAAFLTQANSWRTANHVARGLATGQLSIAGARTLVEDSLERDILIEHSGGLLRVEISVPYSQIGIGMLTPWGNLRASIFQRIEPHVRLM